MEKCQKYVKFQFLIVVLNLKAYSHRHHILTKYQLMGLLSDLGPIVDFQTAKKQQEQIKIIGIKQFLHRLKLYASWHKPTGLSSIKWGEEIEGHFLTVNQQGDLQLGKGDLSEQYQDLPFPVVYQYGSWMFEIIPKAPHTTTCNFYEYIASLRERYELLRSKQRIPMTIPCLPILGTTKKEPFNNQITQSIYIDDDHIANHPRFRTLTKHIRTRREHTVEIYVPIYNDTNTKQEELDQTQPRPGFIYMDAMAFGMGCNSLQCTFSTKNLDHARYVYDQLNVLSPIFLALTAGSPFFKGKVADWDVRWNVICDSVDDRTPSERDPKSADYIPDSRYSAASYYLWDNPMNKPEYNDFKTGVKEETIQLIKKLAEEADVKLDDRLIFHLANIFRRDYLIIHEKFKDMPEDQFALFDMLNGTNWNSVRLKVPIDDDIGWRVEFRTMEVQLTADQNAAYSILIHLIARILHENNDINLYIPITKLRENFTRAHQKDAVLNKKFYFRTNIYGQGDPVIEQLSVLEILFGKGNYRGIIHEIDRRLESCVKVCPKVQELVNCMKKFIYDTASGQRLTLARWMRQYVNKHPEYTHNSILSKRVMNDLLMTLHKIDIGQIEDKNFSNIFPVWNLKEQEKPKCFPKMIEV